MNILFITFQGDIAGSTNSISYLAKGLAERGHNVYLGARKESLLFELLASTDVNLLPMTFKSRFDRVNMRQIRDVVRQYNIQIINAQSSLDRYTTIFAKWKYRLNVKIVHTRRQISNSVGGFFQSWIYQKGTAGIVAVSEGVKRSLIDNGIKDKHITVIRNGTPADKYKAVNDDVQKSLIKKYQIKQGDTVIGCVSRKKNQIQILQALALFDEPVTAIFLGIEKQPEYDEIIANYKVSHRLYFEGILDGDEVLNHYPLFSAHVLASTMEGLSQSLLEAMYLRAPVIATAAAGNLDLVQDGENGLLFEDGDIQGLKMCLKRLINDQDLKKRLTDQAFKTASEEYSIHRTVVNYENYFNQLIAP
ncbi:MAG: glycosyltransferase family 4 protein [Bacteroidota bacterium]